MEFSELSPKMRKISPSAVKMTYDSKHGVWDETDPIFGQMDYSAKRGRIVFIDSQCGVMETLSDKKNLTLFTV
jgi:hypothetical protein